MKMLGMCLTVALSASLVIAKSDSKKNEPKLKSEDKAIHTQYLRFCEKRVQNKKSLKKARLICKCSLKNILKEGTLDDVKTLSKKSPKTLKFDTEENRKNSDRLLGLSNLEIHSIEDCEKQLSKK